MSLTYTGRSNAPDIGVGNKCFLFFSSYIYDNYKQYPAKYISSSELK